MPGVNPHAERSVLASYLDVTAWEGGWAITSSQGALVPVEWQPTEYMGRVYWVFTRMDAYEMDALLLKYVTAAGEDESAETAGRRKSLTETLCTWLLFRHKSLLGLKTLKNI